MVCDNCKSQLATVLVQQNINGHTHEIHLCETCAAKLEKTFTFDSFLQSFLNSFLVDGVNTYENSAKASELTCSKCGLAFDGFKTTGRLGCPECYNFFRSQLSIIFKNIQGSSVHKGKFPKRSAAGQISKHQIQDLKTELAKAITTEDYEAAARIRDKIRALEGSDHNE